MRNKSKYSVFILDYEMLIFTIKSRFCHTILIEQNPALWTCFLHNSDRVLTIGLLEWISWCQQIRSYPLCPESVIVEAARILDCKEPTFGLFVYINSQGSYMAKFTTTRLSVFAPKRLLISEISHLRTNEAIAES